jgi:hypothetical protein
VLKSRRPQKNRLLLGRNPRGHSAAS